MYDSNKKLSDALLFAALASESKIRREKRDAKEAKQRASEKPIAPYLAAAMR